MREWTSAATADAGPIASAIEVLRGVAARLNHVAGNQLRRCSDRVEHWDHLRSEALRALQGRLADVELENAALRLEIDAWRKNGRGPRG